MKRNIAILLAFIMAIMLCACSGSRGITAEPDVQRAESAESGRITEENTENPKEEEAESSELVRAETPAAYTIADEVVVDNEKCTFTIKKAEDDSIWGFTLKAFCENKTSDISLMFSVDDVAVNGYMIDPFWATEVAPGRKSNSDITFSSTAFKNSGITYADEIVFTLRIHDSDDWNADYVVWETFSIYPTGLSADSVDYPSRRTTATEQVVVNNDDICFVILEKEDGVAGGCSLSCYLENKTDGKLMFSWDDVSVNGFMIDPFWASAIAPGMRNYSDISFSSSSFDENDITQVEEIEFTLRVHDYDDWFGDDVFRETLTYIP